MIRSIFYELRLSGENERRSGLRLMSEIWERVFFLFSDRGLVVLLVGFEEGRACAGFVFWVVGFGFCLIIGAFVL